MKPTAYIQCKFCEWKASKWGNGADPHKAFKRLRVHLIDHHEDKITEEMLDMMEANSDMEYER